MPRTDPRPSPIKVYAYRLQRSNLAFVLIWAGLAAWSAYQLILRHPFKTHILWLGLFIASLALLLHTIFPKGNAYLKIYEDHLEIVHSPWRQITIPFASLKFMRVAGDELSLELGPPRKVYIQLAHLSSLDRDRFLKDLNRIIATGQAPF